MAKSKKVRKVPKQSYDPVNNNYLVIIGAIIAIIIVLVATVVINRSKLEVSNEARGIDITPGMIAE